MEMILGFVFILGFVLGLMLIAFDDGIPFGLFKKIRCLIGWHKRHTGLGKYKTPKYYCRFCKKPRKHPALKLVDCGNKIGYDKYRF